jgi:hypothetical protein
MDSVHDITRNLERMLNEQGLESPFWSTDEIIPQFKGLHTKFKENMDRRQSRVESPCPVPTPPAAPTTAKTRGGKSNTIGSTKGRPLLRLLSSDYSSDTAPRRAVLPPSHDPIGGYDDLGMRTLQRDGRAYLKTFFYDCRSDRSCSLPLVLANGLEKRLSSDTIDVALDMLETLTSPLRPCREATIQEGENEEGDDDTMKDQTTGSRRSLAGLTLDGSMISIGHLHFSVASLQPTNEGETKKKETVELTV